MIRKKESSNAILRAEFLSPSTELWCSEIKPGLQDFLSNLSYLFFLWSFFHYLLITYSLLYNPVPMVLGTCRDTSCVMWTTVPQPNKFSMLFECSVYLFAYCDVFSPFWRVSYMAIVKGPNGICSYIEYLLTRNRTRHWNVRVSSRHFPAPHPGQAL